MANIAVFKPMASVQLKGGELLYIPAEAMETLAKKTSGFVQIGDEFVNVFEIVRMRPVKMNDLEQAIFAYPSDTRSKIMKRRAELQEKLGRDFKDPSEVHRFAESL